MRDVWSQLADIPQVLPPEQWMLVGGLMVHVHATRSGMLHVRPTDDADLVIELAAVSYSAAARAIESLGYERRLPIDANAPIHRFTRQEAHLDLMVPEGSTARLAGHDAVAAPGSRSALRRTVAHTLDSGAVIRIPDLASALSLKGAAYTLPGSNRIRHLQDGVTLLACVEEELDLSRSMRGHVNALVSGLTHVDAWAYADPSTRRKAVRTLRSIRPDWEVPPFVITRRA